MNDRDKFSPNIRVVLLRESHQRILVGLRDTSEYVWISERREYFDSRTETFVT